MGLVGTQWCLGWTTAKERFWSTFRTVKNKVCSCKRLLRCCWYFCCHDTAPLHVITFNVDLYTTQAYSAAAVARCSPSSLSKTTKCSRSVRQKLLSLLSHEILWNSVPSTKSAARPVGRSCTAVWWYIIRRSLRRAATLLHRHNHAVAAYVTKWGLSYFWNSDVIGTIATSCSVFSAIDQITAVDCNRSASLLLLACVSRLVCHVDTSQTPRQVPSASVYKDIQKHTEAWSDGQMVPTRGNNGLAPTRPANRPVVIYICDDRELSRPICTVYPPRTHRAAGDVKLSVQTRVRLLVDDRAQ